MVMFLWNYYPLLKTTYTSILSTANVTNPIVANVKIVADEWFLFLPLFVVIVGGMAIFLYLTRVEGYDI